MFHHIACGVLAFRGPTYSPALCMFLCVVSSLITPDACQSAQTDRYGSETQLLTDLLQGYNKQARPVYDPMDTVAVSVSFHLLQIGDLDAKTQELHLLAWMKVFWQDEYLTWDPSEHGGINILTVDSQYLWTPDIIVENSARSVHTDLNSPQFKTIVTSNGSVSWYTSGEVDVNCAMVMTTFPFDQHACLIQLLSWSYGGDQMSLRSLDTSVKMDDYVENGQWEVIETPIGSTLLTFEDEKFYGVDITIKLKRKPLFYVMNVLLPCVMLSVLVMLVFALPADSGEKVSLGITVLLSFSVFQLLVSDAMPETSDNTPVISVYLLSVMGLSVLSIVCTLVVLRAYHSDTASGSPPRWLQRLAFATLPRLPLMPKKSCGDELEGHPKSSTLDQQKPTLNAAGTTGSPSANPKFDAKPTLNAPGATGSSSANPMFHLKELGFAGNEGGALQSDRNGDLDVKFKLLLAMKQDLAMMTGKLRDDEQRSLVKEEWVAVAKLLDRCFMLLFLLVTLLVSIVLLWIVPNV